MKTQRHENDSLRKDILQKDRRYNHTYGRAVAVFDRSVGGPLTLLDRAKRKDPNLGKKGSKAYKPVVHTPFD